MARKSGMALYNGTWHLSCRECARRLGCSWMETLTNGLCSGCNVELDMFEPSRPGER
jgi:hypothetical protein